MSKPKNKALLVIFLVVFFDLLSFGIVIPILPYYAKQFGAEATAWSAIMAIYSIAQFFFAPLWGMLSDRYGRRPILLVSIGLGALSMFLLGYANSLLQIFLCRMLAGIFAANISTATAYIADSTSGEDRAKGMGIIGAGFGLGFLLGPVVGGLLSPYGYHVPIWLAAGIGTMNLLLAIKILAEPISNTRLRQQNRRRYNFKLVQQTLGTAKTRWPVVLFFLSTLAFTQLEVSFAFYVLDRFQYDAFEAGLLLGLMGLIMVVIQGGAIGRLSKRFGEQKLCFNGFILLACGLAIAVLPISLTVFIFGLVVIAIGHALINPSLSSIMSKASPDSDTGGMMGVYHSASALGRIIGPFIAGFAYDHISISSPLIISIGFLLFAIPIAGYFILPQKLA